MYCDLLLNIKQTIIFTNIFMKSYATLYPITGITNYNNYIICIITSLSNLLFLLELHIVTE